MSSRRLIHRGRSSPGCRVQRRRTSALVRSKIVHALISLKRQRAFTSIGFVPVPVISSVPRSSDQSARRRTRSEPSGECTFAIKANPCSGSQRRRSFALRRTISTPSTSGISSFTSLACTQLPRRARRGWGNADEHVRIWPGGLTSGSSTSRHSGE